MADKIITLKYYKNEFGDMMKQLRWPWLMILPTLFLLLGHSLSYANTHSQSEAIPLTTATVYLNGAELSHSGKINLPAGESTVIFTGISQNIKEDSLFISAEKELIIKSSTIQRDYLRPPLTDKDESLKQLLKSIQQERESIKVKELVLDRQIEALDKNITLGSDKSGVTVNEIQALWDFVAFSMSDALERKLNLAQYDKELSIEAKKLEQQLQEQRRDVENQPVTNIVVTFLTKEALETTLDISYAIDNARWTPSYDLFSAKKDAPLEIVYKADVEQFSGFDWQNVLLTFSTSELKNRINKIHLAPHYLAVRDDSAYSSMRKAYKGDVMQQGVMSPEMSRSKETLDEYVHTDLGGINVTYQVTLPYTIPSDGKSHEITLKKEKAKGNYTYIAAPLLREAVYLQVELSDWEELNLLPGKSNLYFEGRYIGQTEITMDNIYEENLPILLGEDRRIMITREQVGFYREKPSFLGNTLTQKYNYSLNLRNMRNEAVTVKVIDQIPISRDNTIKISDIKHDRVATFDEKTGEVTWIVRIEPTKTIKLPLSYVIRYPKDTTVRGLP